MVCLCHDRPDIRMRKYMYIFMYILAKNRYDNVPLLSRATQVHPSERLGIFLWRRQQAMNDPSSVRTPVAHLIRFVRRRYNTVLLDISSVTYSANCPNLLPIPRRSALSWSGIPISKGDHTLTSVGYRPRRALDGLPLSRLTRLILVHHVDVDKVAHARQVLPGPEHPYMLPRRMKP